jgi:hypothetical protein
VQAAEIKTKKRRKDNEKDIKSQNVHEEIQITHLVGKKERSTKSCVFLTKPFDMSVFRNLYSLPLLYPRGSVGGHTDDLSPHTLKSTHDDICFPLGVAVAQWRCLLMQQITDSSID